MLLPIPKQITVISPHLDDAVFSCGCLLAESRDALVITVFAGVPDPDIAAPAWDVATGFSSGYQAVLARREEDTESMRRLGVRGTWLSFWDGQYGRSYQTTDLVPALKTILEQRGGTVLMPMGLLHPDHLLTSNACLAVREAFLLAQQYTEDGATDHPMKWFVYEEAIYRQLPGLVLTRLAAWKQAGLGTSAVRFPTSSVKKKAYAVGAYQSQLPLFGAAKRADMGSPERYWQLDTERPLHR
ncbi:PIG-L family deacetylase [Pseudomonas sp. PCH199]|uniref:PIG-L family deacetylase n=1 Tax=unclassified Pseudomonas TaxID=196821 RepID=UPI000BC6ACDB|nr:MULTISPECIES: PIG-L family deacetylase [unclassified Pseudomonas]MCW8278174.1 PIG-L family deacetylase [Pseudomonas sp. PCH199]PAM81652.1 PIG-L family deacetylase [Pseudomonas sp. ERMR1:02]